MVEPARNCLGITQIVLLVALAGLAVGSVSLARHAPVDWGAWRALEFSHDGQTLAVDAHWRSAHRLALVDVQTGRPRAMLDVGGEVAQVVFSSDDRSLTALVTSDATQSFSRVDAVLGRVLRTEGAFQVSFDSDELLYSPDETLSAGRAQHPDGTIWQVHDLATGEKLCERTLPSGPLRWSPDSRQLIGLVPGGEDPSHSVLVAFDARTGATLPPPVRVAVPQESDSLALAPGLTHIAIGRTGSGVAMLELATQTTTPVFLASDATRPASFFAFLATVWLILWELAARDWLATARRGTGAGLGFHVGMGFALVAFGSSLGYLGYPDGAEIDVQSAGSRAIYLAIAAAVVGLPLAWIQVRNSTGVRRIMGWIGGVASLCVFPIGWELITFALV